ncbi:hypothetical protein [Phytohabitans rumicis]|uniref:Uncharacterized protein n=2 Tax=Phytohabitans rumicis TaxID=1076125 RepID=A0A6V8L531_9ACTN|nr:hypothetical protein [Phytohabitans rumicis]GFJ90660.1 hypothetical protein Prum_043020 [Phytohabitans rumicis]
MIGEWQITTMTEEGIFTPDSTGQPIATGVADLGAWSAAYLVGIFGLVGCLGLVLFGRPTVRDHARVLGLTTTGVLAAILVAIAIDIDDRSVVFGPMTFGGAVPYEVEYGRGLTTAFIGVVFLGVALFISGRLMPAPPPAQPSPEAAPEKADEEPAEQADWPWRRPRQAREAHDPEADLPPPIDLTVAPTPPFVPLPDGKTDS